MAADLRHRTFGIAAPSATFPRIKLSHYIGSAQPGERWIAWQAFTGGPVAGGTLGLVERRIGAGLLTCPGEGQAGVVSSHGQSVVHRHLPGYRPHLRMSAQAFGIICQLPCKIAGIATRERWRQVAVAFTSDAVTGGAGKPRAGIAAGQGDKFAGLAEPRRARWVGRARPKQDGASDRRMDRHRPWNRLATPAVPDAVYRGSKYRSAVLLLALAACKPVPDSRFQIDDDAAKRGKLIAQRVQCGACHVMPGVDWPQGRLGPSLESFDPSGLIAGTLPATPDNLAAFIRNAPAVKPETSMPAMPLSERESRDVAHYLAAEASR
jgi:mono/diheme cytochrome c family protein